jgi:hypothetical protein
MALTYDKTYDLLHKVATAVYTNGTSVWIGTDSGEVLKYTLATGAKVSKVIQIGEKITALAVTSTHLYIGTDVGNVYSYVLSSAAYESIPLSLGGNAITTLTVSSSTLIITTNGGMAYNYTIS